MSNIFQTSMGKLKSMSIFRNREKLQSRIDRAGNKGTVTQTAKLPEFDFAPMWQAKYGEREQIRPFNNTYVNEVLASWRMYKEDVRVKTSINGIAEDATQKNRNNLPFTLNVKLADGSETPETEQIKNQIKEFYETFGIYSRCMDIIKRTLIEGSRFYVMNYDFEKNQVVGFNFIKGPRHGFLIFEIDQGEYQGYFIRVEIQTGKVVNAWPNWMVIRFDWDRAEEDSWGSPLFSSGSKYWDKLQKTENDLYTARRERAYPKTVKKYPNYSLEELKEIIEFEREQEKKYGRETIESTIYTSGDASMLDSSSSAIYNITDVEYFQRLLLNAGRRPAALQAGFGKDAANKAVLDRQEDRYQKGLITEVRSMFSNGLLKFTNNILVLNNHLPSLYKISFDWTQTSLEDKKALGTVIASGVDRKALPLSAYASLFDLDAEETKAAIEADLEWLAEMRKKYEPDILFDPGFSPPDEANISNVE